ncbi:MAG: type II secretion system secretin GspD [Verrucomicrobiota bacterium]|jgi:general secretion pathway protein D|nr:type II secretion system secretin GspD [Verrucomicrobiota bacterium]
MRTSSSPFSSGLTWLLAGALFVSGLPPTVSAQDGSELSPAEEARARIQRLRAERAPVSRPAPGDAGFTPVDLTAGSEGVEGDRIYQFNLVKDAPLDALLDMYSQVTGRTMIKAPGVNATFPNIRVRERLSKEEMIQVMDSLLSMNNISLVPLGTRFYRVVPIDKAATEGMEIQRQTPEGGHPESDALVSQLIQLKYLEMEDAVNIVQAMLHGFGKVQRLDRINSLLVQETSTNLRRIYEILEMVDQPTEMKVETRIYEIQHAKASDIASRLNELVSDSQGERREQVAQVAQPVPLRRPNMIRARQPVEGAASASSTDTAAALEAAMAAQGIIQGKVKVLIDERTNIIIVISRPANFEFFDKIVAVLDRPVDPEVVVQVIALEYADAEEVSSLLNDFIGTAKSDSDTGAGRIMADSSEGDSRARALEDFVRSRAAAADRIRSTAGDAAVSRIGQLSPNTKILADTRTNTLLLMGTKGDVAALHDVINKVDIMLAQVLLEAVILEVNLNNSTAYGVNWLQKSMTAYSQNMVNGVSLREPVASWGGSFGPNNFLTAAGDTITRAFGGGTGLNYYFTFNDLNIDMVLDMVARSGEGRVLATPVILTTDNKEASIMSGTQIPIRTGDSSSGGTFYSDYEYKDVGIQLKVKPRINPSRYVTMEITQSADTLGDPVDVGSGTMYSINKREMSASISMPSRSTIVLGGLVQTDYQASNTRVPILGSIPILGALFRSESKNRTRTELLVLITPYVLMTPEEARLETERLHRASNVAAEDWYRGWSDSSLAPFSPTKVREMEQEEKANARQAQMRAVDGKAENIEAPVQLIEPAPPMERPSPEAKPAADFEREMQQLLRTQAEAAQLDAMALGAGPLPAPAEPASTAPFVFDPAGSVVPEVRPERVVEPMKPQARKDAPRRSLFGRVKVLPTEEPKPSMFASPG